MRSFVCLMGVVLIASTAAAAPNLSISSEPYIAGGFFTNPVLPRELEPVTITVRAAVDGTLAGAPQATVTIVDASGTLAAEQTLTLRMMGDTCQATWAWVPVRNGVYRAHVRLDPGNQVEEADESDNAASLMLPVLIAEEGGVVHFPWYRVNRLARWATCVTAAPETEFTALAERGVIPLTWAPARTAGYDKDRAKTEPHAVLAEVEEALFQRYVKAADPYGCGIDEFGGYPDTFSLDISVAAMKALVRARKAKPNAFFAAWNCGGTRPQIAALARQSADLFLLETYLWRALPDELGAQDIYEAIACRVDPIIRATDMFEPAYGNRCYTLVALDTTERPDRTDPGELEQVVRFVRRRWPEMRGIAWYNGSTRMEKTPKNLRVLDDLQVVADDLCFEYWVKPCITLQRESLWLTANDDASADLNLAVSNLGAMDSGTVTVEYIVNGASAGHGSVSTVPAGSGRNESMALLKHSVRLTPGVHHFEARIVSAPDATVLDPVAELTRYAE
ncbi:MAG: hypothetical protein GY851_06535 [bacterium]|nr:hypothetical protein [bacterium]